MVSNETRLLTSADPEQSAAFRPDQNAALRILPDGVHEGSGESAELAEPGVERARLEPGEPCSIGANEDVPFAIFEKGEHLRRERFGLRAHGHQSPIVHPDSQPMDAAAGPEVPVKILE